MVLDKTLDVKCVQYLSFSILYFNVIFCTKFKLMTNVKCFSCFVFVLTQQGRGVKILDYPGSFLKQEGQSLIPDGRSTTRVEACQRRQSWNIALVCTMFALCPLDSCNDLSPLMCSVCCRTEGGVGWLAHYFHLNQSNNTQQGGFPSAISTH